MSRFRAIPLLPAQRSPEDVCEDERRLRIAGKHRGRWGECLVTGKSCFGKACRLGEATVWLMLRAGNDTDSPRRDQQLRFFKILEKQKYKCSAAESVSTTQGPASGVAGGVLGSVCLRPTPQCSCSCSKKPLMVFVLIH